MSLAVKLPAAATSAGLPSAPGCDEVRPTTPGQQQRAAVWGISISAWLLGLLMWTLAISLCLLIVFRHAAVARVGIDMTRTRERIAKLAEENQALEAQVQEMMSISRIEKVAMSRLGMVRPANFRTVAMDRSVLAREPAAPPAQWAGPTSRPGGPAAAQAPVSGNARAAAAATSRSGR